MSTTLETMARERLALARAASLTRSLTETERLPGGYVLRGGQKMVSFSCNDYFGLSFHPQVLAAAREALTAGTGAGASRLVTGNHAYYGPLEAELAAWKGTEAALVFGSGYLASLGVIPALVGAGDVIVADRLIHACMIDAARLSGATLMRFSHNNLDHCRLLLEEHRGEYARCLVLTETVFSMDGDRAPVKALHALAQQHDAWLMTDDAHGLGLFPAEPVEVQMGTLSKGAGVYGGYICASRAVIDWLVGHARTAMFSTGLPPADIAAARMALHVLRANPKLAQDALERARWFTAALGREPAQSAIVPVIVQEPERALEAAAMLAKNHILAMAIRPPTVPPGTARLRFAFSALHEAKDITRAAHLLQEHGYA